MTIDLRSAYDGKRVCVTGGAGFIGSHLCAALAGHGARVRVIDDLSNGHLENLDPIRDRVEFFEASILNAEGMAAAAADAEIVFHQAAVASVPRSVEAPDLYERVNVAGTVAVLEAARAGGGKRVVFASSSSVYGDQPELPKVETMSLDPRSPYAASKCAGEQFVRAYAACYPLSTVSLRYFNIFGARQRADSPYAAVIPKFADSLVCGRVPVIYGDGSQTRDFTHVDNAVHANLLAGASTRYLKGEAVNVAAGEERSVLELLEGIARIIGVPAAHETQPVRAGDVLHSCAGLDAIRDLLDFEPIVTYDQGLSRTIGEFLGTGGSRPAAETAGDPATDA